jgi:hypothetical protein
MVEKIAGEPPELPFYYLVSSALINEIPASAGMTV